MALFGRALAPNDVFTPRMRDINERMYVDRPDLERRLVDALKGDKYIIVHGESGNGKTWLYKRVLASQGIEYEIVNLANANLHGSLLGAFEAKLSELGYYYDAEYNTEIDAGFKPGGIGAGYKDQKKTVAAPQSAFLALITEIRRKSGERPAVLVLDNFEQIIDNSELLKSVASIIISADEMAIASKKVKILIVGVPSNLRELGRVPINGIPKAARF